MKKAVMGDVALGVGGMIGAVDVVALVAGDAGAACGGMMVAIVTEIIVILVAAVAVAV